MTPTSAAIALPHGLTSAEAEERRITGRANIVPGDATRSHGQILRSNLFTRFNAIVVVLVGVVLAVGSPIDATFGVIAVFNALIGIVQEERAKRTLDRLSLFVTPMATVRRDGAETTVPPSELVLDDVLHLRTGDQVPLDGEVLISDGLEVDESALTGEADAVPKQPGDEIRSGSAVVAGSGYVRATRVGRDAWIQGLVEQAKAFTLTNSELRAGIDRLLRIISWSLPPLALLLLWSQLRGTSSVRHGLVATVAGVVGLVPQGLVLLVSMTMAIAIVRLARNHVVVQELHAVEGLARVDMLCLDKTGTLTTGKMAIDEIVAFTTLERLTDGIGALVAAEANPTSSTTVLAQRFSPPPGWVPTVHVAFSSARKWSGTTFAGRGTWLIGAPDVVLDAIDDTQASSARTQVETFSADAKRVLLVAWSSEPLGETGPGNGARLPGGLVPLGLVVLGEQLREDAAEILEYFRRQGVTVKIISGDSAATVSAVARRLGIPGAERAVDLRDVPTAAIDEVALEAVVFGRVHPHQKRELVEALQAAGHTVAMTGDGVNDIPALKRADIGIAVDTATQATKVVSQLVLLDGRFDRLPHVVAEGRRVIANMERVSALFITKSIYAAWFAMVIGISGHAFPLLPRHVGIVADLTIGLPAFVLSFRSANEPCRPGYLGRVLRFAVPTGTAAAIVTLSTYWLVQSSMFEASLAEARTAATMALTTVSLWALYRLMLPLDRLDAIVLAAMTAVFVTLLTLPVTREFYALDWPAEPAVAATAAVVLGAVIVAEFVMRVLRPQRWLDQLRPVHRRPPVRDFGP